MKGGLGILVSIDMESGVSTDTGEGFLTVRAVAESGEVLVGQLPPKAVRQMALDWLEAAEAAEMDAIVMAQLIEDVGLEQEAAAMFVGALRKRRAS